MRAYVDGDQQAFEVLFNRYAPTVLRLGRRHLHSNEAARELVQQTFLRMHHARRDYNDGERLRPWLMTIVMNLVRDRWRIDKRRPTTELRHEPAAEVRDEGRKLDEARRAAALRDALSQLPEGQREVIELHWLQGRPFAEVAQVVGSSTGAVRVRAHRGYEKLKQLLAGKLESDDETA